MSLVGAAGSSGIVRGCIEDLPEQLATKAQMQDLQDEKDRRSTFTNKSSDMPGSRSNEDSASPVSAQREGRSSGEAHPKKKRKVNHGQNLLLQRAKRKTDTVYSMYLLSTLGELFPTISSSLGAPYSATLLETIR